MDQQPDNIIEQAVRLAPIVYHTCKQCAKKLPVTDFYITRMKVGGRPANTCKFCWNVGKYTKKAVGWAKIDPVAQARIILQLADRRNKLKDIAEQEAIPYASLRRWFMEGKLN